MCGVFGILFSVFNCNCVDGLFIPMQMVSCLGMILVAAEFTQGSQKTDYIIPAQDAQNLITLHRGQLADTVPVQGPASIACR